ncbi:DegT/DnrJ/EryC1/StrS family aminotransferase [Arenibacter sp. 6A1]|uniref:DegT/DnrJ/EryC1/StrS family aminotransferase n=1 Tax=Arenibacter sp. 6A1 TaxID=2720391 RepID=UPI001446B9C3|nr:DegT/DnrJ/EryC1/StrS family aminotransferase [Arenibacter sp. 6A1]NKI26835.1 DegT/DnrJ/EryC1/StrS family aminotransferase [Arenibacter sp. 6A1]
MIPITKPFLPPKEEYEKMISIIWESHWLTNSGPLVEKLEKELLKELAVSNLLFVVNGTMALQLAIKALCLEGEIITTPFSFVATTSSIVWENNRPVFVDIDSDTLNIDASKIEAAITPKTVAIVATHVFGNPCDVVEIEKIAKKHKLKVIYDGAHAFGVKIEGKSIFEFGDISICSTHATKIYHTTEGGFIVTKDKKLLKELRLMINFGFKSAVSFANLGINAKNSEFHAAMGLVNLKYIEENWENRKKISLLYDSILSGSIKKQSWADNATISYAYYPVIFNSEMELEVCIESLLKENIIPRRYFYPLLSESLPYVAYVKLPIAEDVSRRVLCLPLYNELALEVVERIGRVICNSIKDSAVISYKE